MTLGLVWSGGRRRTRALLGGRWTWKDDTASKLAEIGDGQRDHPTLMLTKYVTWFACLELDLGHYRSTVSPL